MKAWVIALALLATPASARPVVLELYTSTACSSCPPADALVAQLAASDKNLLVLSFNVTYWNNAAYADADALPAATARQAWYAGLRNDPNVYTPEAIVDGGPGMVGSDQSAITRAIAAAAAAPAGDVPVKLSGTAMVTVTVPAGAGGADVLLVGYDSKHTTQVGGGENGGATLTQINVVRSMTDFGPWSGARMAFTISRPAGEHMAVILQAPDGRVLGAAFQ